MARMMTGRVVPNTEMKTAASAMPGKDMTMSMIRMITSEIHLRETAATEPITAPHSSAKAVAANPMTSEYRAP